MAMSKQGIVPVELLIARSTCNEHRYAVGARGLDSNDLPPEVFDHGEGVDQPDGSATGWLTSTRGEVGRRPPGGRGIGSDAVVLSVAILDLLPTAMELSKGIETDTEHAISSPKFRSINTGNHLNQIESLWTSGSTQNSRLTRKCNLLWTPNPTRVNWFLVLFY
ncbi:hypothetical protein BHM03_00012029 [Ensete ventricosum]|nr:hypothetical protein BHM03_00012029 [Ensete ventricosum]